MTQRRIVVATRKSELALAQCRQFLERLVARHPHVVVEELHVITTGDRILEQPLASIGGKGLFLKELEEKLLDGSADIAVHSMKDVPPALHADLCIGCIPEREDPRDVLVTTDGRPLSLVPKGGTLGTSSLRRAVQIRLLRPDLTVVPIRGNVGTRIRKCRDGEVDVTVLARAGLNRLGLTDEASETLSTDACLPAVGQGALAIELRVADQELRELLLTMQDHDTAVRTAAERGVMTAVEGDCKTPVAAFGEHIGDELRLRAFLAEPDGTRIRKDEVRVPFPVDSASAHEIGLSLGRRLKSA
jgi:hydroxymethylbilane synthase